MHVSSYIHTFRKTFNFRHGNRNLFIQIHPNNIPSTNPCFCPVLKQPTQVCLVHTWKKLRTYYPKMVKHGDEADGRIRKKSPLTNKSQGFRTFEQPHFQPLHVYLCLVMLIGTCCFTSPSGNTCGQKRNNLRICACKCKYIQAVLSLPQSSGHVVIIQQLNDIENTQVMNTKSNDTKK